FKMVDQRFHRALHFAARRWRYLAVVDFDRSLRHCSDSLLDDANRLPHFLDPNEIPIVGIPVAPDRNIKFHLVVSIIWLGPAEIPGHVRASQHRSGKPPIGGLLGGYHADI